MKAFVLGLSLLATGLAVSITSNATESTPFPIYETARTANTEKLKEHCLKKTTPMSIKLTGNNLNICTKDAE